MSSLLMFTISCSIYLASSWLLTTPTVQLDFACIWPAKESSLLRVIVKQWLYILRKNCFFIKDLLQSKYIRYRSCTQKNLFQSISYYFKHLGCWVPSLGRKNCHSLGNPRCFMGLLYSRQTTRTTPENWWLEEFFRSTAKRNPAN